MIQFLLKGLLRDRSRSLLPIIIIAIGVMITVLLTGYINGVYGDVIDQNARFDTGHVKIMSKAYAKNKEQIPNDLALLEVSSIVQKLQKDFPSMDWVKRIKFGGLVDVPDAEGNTKTQGPAIGMALDILSHNSEEVKRMRIKESLVTGKLPQQIGEVLIGHEFAQKLGLKLGEDITYFGTTMEGSMTFKSFTMVGTIRFGAAAMDKGACIIDVIDAQMILDMEDGAGEILGFLNAGVYQHKDALNITEKFNSQYKNSTDEYDPIMKTLKEQNGLGELIDMGESMSSLFVFIFILAMSVVLWNTGLLGGLRRYQEFGIRLALGESKNKIYQTLILEALLIGFIGSCLGTFIGLSLTYYIQVVGIDISSYLKNNSMIMPSIIRSKVTPELFYIGFIPGVFAMVFGTMLSGMGIYKRETANLFKELEV